MPVDTSKLISRLKSLSIDGHAIGEGSILHATLAVLGEMLSHEEAARLAACLPTELSDLVQGGYDAGVDAAEFFERVRRRAKVDAGIAREQAQVVLLALGEGLPPEIVALLERALPEDVSRHLYPRVTAEPPRHVEPARSEPLATLAGGRPGSRQPLSEERPRGAQSESVAVTVEPHADTKLSSARGSTQEALGRTLAEGRSPEAARPLHGVREESASKR